ncbi:secretory antigen precursor [Staphylococcus gallinarum]|uniref:Secretory antigen n=1 Tax=Staphylococcus gallinarum TaxID=1293 RepID=A0A380FM50_STAGA|nr:secretory antigen precursor [Staphylococcus gallinarum]
MQITGLQQHLQLVIQLTTHLNKAQFLQSNSGPYGHVAYVENVSSDGSVTVSEMNYGGGPYSVSERTISSSEASSYNYIHLN